MSRGQRGAAFLVLIHPSAATAVDDQRGIGLRHLERAFVDGVVLSQFHLLSVERGGWGLAVGRGHCDIHLSASTNLRAGVDGIAGNRHG